jgi:hypothetical protein
MPPSGTPIAAGAPISANPGLFLRHAGVSISGHKVVYIDDDDLFQVVDPADDAACGIAIGVTVQAAAQGELQYARFAGELIDQSFDWIEGPIFLGPNGSLTQTKPETGNVLIVGVSAGRNVMRVSVSYIAKLLAGV